ncbi:ELKS/Rab6-interacting/CAST family protein [Haladaptatus sp. DYF46]|uniref:ELKS/Rab6-interacting/CAST family protein n=1 Tax=Haladaptatus sp. DYF46 TaxID=2886041 RepID=UPI001E37A489|nr:ELKS/Rab6-interacting/CAST family protein [Haladaptatus sp. DYF46]
MSGKSASLLTKTQRNRIRNDFEDLDEEKRHRDQQRIRDRVKSGLHDFQLLANYPDRQFAVMLEDIPDDEVRAALADTTIVVERLREQSEIEREALVEEVRTHIEGYSDGTEDTKTLKQIDLRTVAEIQQQTEDNIAEQFETGRWDKRANGLMKLGVSVFIPIVLGLVIPSATPISLSHPAFTLIFIVLSFVLFVSAICWVLITTAQSLKYNILPFLVKLTKNPRAAMRGVFTKLVKNPRETVRESWDEL